MPKKLITEAEERFIRKDIGPQLSRSETVQVHVHSGNCRLNYCMIDNGDPISFQHVVLLLTGFLSGWTGIALLGYELAKLGYRVYMPSMLGYGNSSNPPRPYRDDFLDEACTLHDLMKQKLHGRSIHVIGHSEGALVGAALAYRSQGWVKTLTMLDPVGFQKRNMLELMASFGLNGFGHKRAFKGDPKWKILSEFLPVQKSPLAPDRLGQRWSELRRISSGTSLQYLKEVATELPVNCIYGTRDSFCECKIACEGIRYIALPGLWHNTTMFGSDQTAKAIDACIFEHIK